MKSNFISVLMMLLMSGFVSNAQDIFLDSTFGNNGIVTAEFFTTNAMALQSDGKILVAGSKFGTFPDPIILRFNADGRRIQLLAQMGKFSSTCLIQNILQT